MSLFSKSCLFLLFALIQPLSADTATIEAAAGGAGGNATVTVIIDSDRDGLTDAQEAAQGTDSQKPDTDGDGLTDKSEVDAGKNPLVNQFAADPDWSSIPAATAGRIWGFWDFETFNGTNKTFASRKGTHLATAMPLANANTVWNQTEGMLGQSAKVGGGAYLKASPVDVWNDYRKWTMALTVKFSAVPSSTAVWPIMSVEQSFAGSE